MRIISEADPIFPSDEQDALKVHFELGGNLAGGLAGLGQFPNLRRDLVALGAELAVMTGGTDERGFGANTDVDLLDGLPATEELFQLLVQVLDDCVPRVGHWLADHCRSPESVTLMPSARDSICCA